MLDQGLENTLYTIKDLKNPEIHHYHRGKHPGIKWYIKTIMPGPKILNNDTYVLYNLWKYLESRFPKLVKLVDCAYDWQGELIPSWYTIWLNEKIDIRVSWNRANGFSWDIVEYDLGLNASAKDALELMDNSFTAARHSKQSTVCYNELCNILEYLKTWTSDKKAKANRQNLRIIDYDEIPSKTSDRKFLDFNV